MSMSARAVELVGRGAGITTHPELLQALESSGAGTHDLGVEVERRIALDRAGRVIAEKRLPQILTSWDRLQRLLRETIDPAHYHLDWNFERVEQNGSEVRVHFSGGRIENADILVGGDGIRSAVRAADLPEVQPLYAGYYIWRGTPNEADLSPRALREVFPYFSFFLPPQQQVICYPIAGFNNDLRPGHRRFNFIWYRVADTDLLKEMCVDENGHQHEYSVPPPLIRKDLIAAVAGRRPGRDCRPPLNDCLRVIEQPFFTPIYDFIAPHIVSGRVALVGDAASNARPHMGFGVSKAGCDAQALADALRDHDDIDTGARRIQPRSPADRRDHRQAQPQARHLHGRRSADRGGPSHARAAAGSARYDGLDRGTEFPGRLSMSAAVRGTFRRPRASGSQARAALLRPSGRWRPEHELEREDRSRRSARRALAGCRRS